MNKVAVLVSLLLAVILTSCGAPQEDEEGLTVYTSIYPLYDFTVKIAGERAVVNSIVPPGADAHDFEPTPADVVALHQADLFIYNGLGLEFWVEKLITAVDESSLKVIDTAAHVDPIEGDPHVWLDPLRAKMQAELIMEALIEIDPDHAEEYQQNYEALARSFDELHQRFETMSHNKSRSQFVVSHEAFGYLAARYGLEQVGVAGLTPAQELSPQRMQEVVRFIREHDINYLLFEPNVMQKVAEMLHAETGAEVLQLHHLEMVSEEMMARGEDYFSLMEHNLQVLETALGQ